VKKITILLLLTLIITGCENQQIVTTPKNDESRFAGLQGEITIVTDNETGCKYLREKYGTGYGMTIGLTVLMRSDGTPDCD
jgi:hypothetical protein